MSDEIKNEQQTNINEGQTQNNSTDESIYTDEQSKEGEKRMPYERFKEKVDEVNELKKRLAEQERAQEEAKRKELEEKEEYKTLYEQAKIEAEKARQEALLIKKNALLI